MLTKALKMLRNDPAGFPSRTSSVIAERTRLALFRRGMTGSGYTVHYGVHRNGNAGDTALFDATRKLFDTQLGCQRWQRLPVRSPVLAADVERMNSHAKAILVGGGGLIIPDSVPDSRSGWQWNIALGDLRRLEKPLILSGVGYNVFYGQRDFSDLFREHIIETVSRAAFVGLRNSGSIRALAANLPGELGDKLRLQPCPTTVISRLYPGFSPAWQPGKHLSINLAFDRAERRFGGRIEDSVRDIALAARHMTDKGWRVTVALHDPRDRYYLRLLRASGLNFDTVDLAHAEVTRIFEFYARTDLTIGMRGHGQMVPFGLQRPIFTLASHPKMKYFLEDIGHPQWGVDIRKPGFSDALIAGMEEVTADPERTRAQLAEAQARLWSVMVKNLELCRPYL